MSRILVIEDEVGTQVLLKGRLHDLGHEVVMASTGAMGLMEARAQAFDLFLVDIHLGTGIDGHEVCRRIKAIPQMRNTPVVLLSGQVNTREELHRGYEAGCEAYLLKGDTNLLEDVVRVMLRIKGLQDELALQNKLLEQRNRAQVEEHRTGDLEQAIRGEGVRAEVLSELVRSRPDGVLVADSEGVVRFADRGARDLFGRDVEGRQIATLTPASGLEAFVRDAVNDPREGYTVELTIGRGSVERALSASVLPLAPRPGDPNAPLRIVLLHDASKRRVAADLLELPAAARPENEVGVLLEAARREFRPAHYLGESDSTIEVRGALEREAKTRNPLRILGEAGTGRMLGARILHYGGFQSGAFIPVDCRALAPDNARSELFGRTAGNNGARIDRPGAFQLAHLGTLMLLDAEALPTEVQVEVANAVQEGRVVRVGNRKREVTEVRLILVSTDPAVGELAPELAELVSETLTTAPLSRRPEDVIPIARHFLTSHSLDGQPCEIAEDALWVLEQYPWPGNVRELKTTIERAVERAEGAQLRGADLPRPLADLYRRFEERNQLPAVPRATETSDAARATRRGRVIPPPPAPLESEPVSLDLYERHCLQRALRETGGDKLAAARLLKVGKSTLYRKLKRYGIG